MQEKQNLRTHTEEHEHTQEHTHTNRNTHTIRNTHTQTHPQECTLSISRTLGRKWIGRHLGQWEIIKQEAGSAKQEVVRLKAVPYLFFFIIGSEQLLH